MAVPRLDALKDAVSAWTWPPAVTFTKKAILGMFSRIETGTLIVVDEAGDEKHRFGEREGKVVVGNGGSGEAKTANSVPRIEIVVKRDAFWPRLFLFADIGFAEAYMLGDFECADLTSFFRVRGSFLFFLFFLFFLS
jgi:cyclopropane-fatty-acyl-phospholipid synthase